MSNAPSAPPTLPTAPPPPAVRPEIPLTLGRVIDVYSNRWEGPRTASICRLIDVENGSFKVVRANVELDGFDDADLLAHIRKSGHGKTVELTGAKVFGTTEPLGFPLPTDRDWYIGHWPKHVGAPALVSGITTRLAEAESKLETLLNQFTEHLAQAAPVATTPGVAGTIASIQGSLAEVTQELKRLSKAGIERDEDILALDTGVSLLGDKTEHLFKVLINAVGSFGPVFNELERVLLKVYEGVQPLGISIDFKALGEAKLECILKLEEMAQTLEQGQKDAAAEDRAPTPTPNPTPDAGAQAAAAVNEDATRAAMGDAPASGEALAGDAPAKPVPGSET